MKITFENGSSVEADNILCIEALMRVLHSSPDTYRGIVGRYSPEETHDEGEEHYGCAKCAHRTDEQS